MISKNNLFLALCLLQTASLMYASDNEGSPLKRPLPKSLSLNVAADLSEGRTSLPEAQNKDLSSTQTDEIEVSSQADKKLSVQGAEKKALVYRRVAQVSGVVATLLAVYGGWRLVSQNKQVTQSSKPVTQSSQIWHGWRHRK